LEGDPVAEGGELGDVVRHAAFDVDAAGVAVGSEVMEVGGRVGEQESDDDQDGTGDRNRGLELAAALDDAAVALAEEGGGLAERALHVWVALVSAATESDGPGLNGARAQLRSRQHVCGHGETGRVQPGLGDDTCALRLPTLVISSMRSMALGRALLALMARPDAACRTRAFSAEATKQPTRAFLMSQRGVLPDRPARRYTASIT
jgi:hypothetical protein